MAAGEPTVRRDAVDGLELLSCEAVGAGAPSRPPLLLVHGACHDGRCWEDNFLPFFAAGGWSTHAVTLRGHRAGAVTGELAGSTLADYVEDVARVADNLPAPPVLIGHSMGGMVVQKYLTSHPAAAAVLLASAPPRGVLRSPAIRHHPLMLMRGLVKRSALAIFSDTSRRRTLLFSDHTPDHVVRDCADRLTEESNAAVLDLFRVRIARRDRATIPMLVVGAREDALFSARQAERTAAFYGADTVVIAGLGHNLMMEPGWRQVADHIESWLKRRFAPTSSVLPRSSAGAAASPTVAPSGAGRETERAH